MCHGVLLTRETNVRIMILSLLRHCVSTQHHMTLWTVWLPLGCTDAYGDDKIMKYEVGQAAYIVENNHVVREVTIVSLKGDFYVVRFENGKGGIRLREHRIFPSQTTAEESILPKEKKSGYRSPHDSA